MDISKEKHTNYYIITNKFNDFKGETEMSLLLLIELIDKIYK